MAAHRRCGAAASIAALAFAACCVFDPVSMNSSTAKVALVTGAARGIGLAVARIFLDQGWRVALLDIDGTALADSADRLAQPARVLALECCGHT
jgi:hypothetical protein